VPDAPVFNPAFDITPHDMVTAVVTERGVHAAAGSGLAARTARRIEVFGDFPRPGIRFQDLSGVYADSALTRALADSVANHFRDEFDHVVAIEARGFVLGGAVALVSGTPLVLARKRGKTPGATHAVGYGLEYGTDSLEMRDGALPRGARALIVDDVLATGGTAAAAAELVTRVGGVVSGFAVVVELLGLGGRERVRPGRVHAVHEVRV